MFVAGKLYSGEAAILLGRQQGRLFQERKMTKYIVCLSCLILMLAACSRSTEEAAIEKQLERATGADADVDLSNEGMTIRGKTEEGEFSFTTGEGTEVPGDFPTDVLIYRPSKVKAAMNVSEGQSLTLTTGDDRQKVQEAYKREMIAKDWSEQASMNMGNQSMLVYEKDDRVAHVTITPEDAETQITIIVGKN